MLAYGYESNWSICPEKWTDLWWSTATEDQSLVMVNIYAGVTLMQSFLLSVAAVGFNE